MKDEMQHDMNHMDMMDHDMMNMDHGSMNHDDMDMSHMNMGNLKQKFWVSLILTIPILLLAPIMGFKFTFGSFELPLVFGGSSFIVVILATILYFYGGKPFLSGAVSELKAKKPAMMTLIAMGITVSYGYSLYAFIMNQFVNPNGHVMDFFFELATLIVIMLLGHDIEMNSVMKAGSAIQKMAALLPSQAHMVHGTHTMDMPLSKIKVGDIVQVLAGEQVPVDGIVTKGTTQVNEALVTGESKMIDKQVNSKVIGGSVNGNGVIEVKVTGTGSSGYLSQVKKLIQEAQKTKSKAESLADKVASWLFYAALIVGILAFIVWLPSGLAVAFERMVTVFVIACPHALGLAIPLVVARSTSMAAANGLLIRNRQALETTPKIQYVLMDKTGTLTEGKFKVKEIESLSDGLSENDVLQLFASLEQNSNHPLATGIIEAAKAKELDLLAVTGATTQNGTGISGMINDKEYQIVNASYLAKNNLKFDESHLDKYSNSGDTVSYLIQDRDVLGLIGQGDLLKNNSIAFINRLKNMGYRPVMLTGDNKIVAQKVAKSLGINEVYGELLPEDKIKIVKQYQKDHKVMMVGDGINDAPSLAQADVGVAIGAGTDVAIDSADVVLVNSKLKDILKFIELSKATNNKMIQNLWWGAGYNLFSIPLAAGILAPIGFVLNPAVGAILMSLSTIIVAINAMTLKIK